MVVVVGCVVVVVGCVVVVVGFVVVMLCGLSWLVLWLWLCVGKNMTVTFDCERVVRVFKRAGGDRWRRQCDRCVFVDRDIESD